MWIIYDSRLHPIDEIMVNTDSGKQIKREGGRITVDQNIVFDGEREVATTIFELIVMAIKKEVHMLDLKAILPELEINHKREVQSNETIHLSTRHDPNHRL
ncbi:hypothetical protein C6499_19345 [Candidatus Poribacteria bacterium]|nr:MAG: hypothetical protein C6499_19345 [Candidatus Poribacteria bacterium]